MSLWSSGLNVSLLSTRDVKINGRPLQTLCGLAGAGGASLAVCCASSVVCRFSQDAKPLLLDLCSACSILWIYVSCVLVCPFAPVAQSPRIDLTSHIETLSQDNGDLACPTQLTKYLTAVGEPFCVRCGRFLACQTDWHCCRPC